MPMILRIIVLSVISYGIIILNLLSNMLQNVESSPLTDANEMAARIEVGISQFFRRSCNW